MPLTTLKVILSDGQITVTGDGVLPAHAIALLTILEEGKKPRDPFQVNPDLHVILHDDPTAPLDPEDWPDACK